MSNKPRRVGITLVTAALASTLGLGVVLLWGANRLFIDRRPDTATPDLWLNEGLLLLSLLVLQGLLVGALSSRLMRPLRELGLMVTRGASGATGTGKAAASNLGEVDDQARLRLAQQQQLGQQALEELDRVRSDAQRLSAVVGALDKDPQAELTPRSELLLALTQNLQRRAQEIYARDRENAAATSQVEALGREAVLAAREAASLAESTYFESSELGVALRELARVITEIRPVLEAGTLPARGALDAVPRLGQVCKILSDVADRHRLFALQVSRTWAQENVPPSGPELKLLEDLDAHLAAVEERREEAERLLAEAPASSPDSAPAQASPRAGAALKKLLQNAEIAHERLSRLTAAAERASSAAQRVNGMAERELQSLEALGVRLEGETGPDEPAETLGESDFVESPER